MKLSLVEATLLYTIVMANTYTQLNTHVVFAVKGRENILPSKMRPELFKYISGILTNSNQFSLAVNGYKDHVHMFFEMSPAKSLSEIVRIVKANSSKWINENKFISGKFSWQEACLPSGRDMVGFHIPGHNVMM
jgi:putative transposase